MQTSQNLDKDVHADGDGENCKCNLVREFVDTFTVIVVTFSESSIHVHKIESVTVNDLV